MESLRALPERTLVSPLEGPWQKRKENPAVTAGVR